ncbi:MAG: hypothetical protein H0X66_19760 [Verrucomicrobia bacterium]|nr:hypothetical protein [Verrucomicrobiota bacterium]
MKPQPGFSFARGLGHHFIAVPTGGAHGVTRPTFTASALLGRAVAVAAI